MPCSRNAEEGLNCKIYLCSLGALAKGEIVAGTSVHVENYLEYGWFFQNTEPIDLSSGVSRGLTSFFAMLKGTTWKTKPA